MRRHTKRSERTPLHTAAGWGVVATLVAALYLPPPAGAADYVVFGQVRQIDPAEAEDESIATADLTVGDAMPFVQVAIFNRATGAELARGWALQNGQFSLGFSAGNSVEIDARAFLVADGGLSQLPAAREDINHVTLTSLGPSTSTGVVVKVASDLISAAGSASALLANPGVGIVFTRVGKVEIPYIEQSLAHTPAAEIGLADMSSDSTTASQLGLPSNANPGHHRAIFEQAPFGGRLLIFGDFGKPGGFACPPGVWDPDWYQVTIEKLNETTFAVTDSFVLTDPIAKKRYEVQTFPLVNVITSSIDIGPYYGKSGSAVGPDVTGLYMRNELAFSPSSQVFYSFPDLRVNWVTGGHNGLYRLKMRYFRHAGWKPGEVNQTPIVQEVPASCILASPPAVSDAAVHELVVRINNQPLLTSFNHIWQKNAAGYLKVAADGTRSRVADPIADGAFDFNDEGLCNVMQFDAGDQVEIDFTARHEGGYLRHYSLSALSNDGTGVPFASDTFTGKPTLPLWHGTAATGATATNTGAFTHDCGYFFDLVARSRVQNGYGYIQGKHPRRTYFVDVP